MKYDVKEIERIIQDIDCNDPEDLDLDKTSCFRKWNEMFFHKLKHKKINSSEEFGNHCKAVENFKNTDCSESDFRNYFPELKYENYICPWDYNIMKVSEKKYQKMAFELQSHIDLDFDKVLNIIKNLYVTFQKPTFENLITYIGMYDNKLYAELLAYSVWLEMKNKKAS